MDVRDFSFDLPADLIAQEPAAERGAARLLWLDRQTGAMQHRTIPDLPALLSRGDVLVVNNTRVFPARLLGHREPSGGAVECLLIRRVNDGTNDASVVAQDFSPAPGGDSAEFWEALMHPGQRLAPGARVAFGGAAGLSGEVLQRLFHGRRLVRLWTRDGSSVDAAVDAIGHVPLPPYIKRPDRSDDRARYQTVFARRRGSVAAPTAGLHLDDTALAGLGLRGVTVVEITLHVGYGTFQPVRVERVEDHRIEPEQYEMASQSADAINRALDERRRVVAVGTTTTRTLEAVARLHGGRMAAGAGVTDLFIYPGFEFQIVGGLLTNFHLPQSSLLMLVSAFGGREHVTAAYAEAIRERYRFYSYGDAMVIL